MQPILVYLASRPDQPRAVQRAGLEVLSGTEVLRTDQGARWLLGLLENSDTELRLPVIKAIEDSRLTAAVPPLIRILADSVRPAPERGAAARALRALNSLSALPVLQEVLAEVRDGTAPAVAALRLEAFRTLAALDPAGAVAEAQFHAERQDDPLQSEAVVVLGATPEGARQAARLFLDRKVSRALLPQVCDSLRRHAGRDLELARLLTEVRKSGLLLSNSPARGWTGISTLVRTQGRPDQGRRLFLDGKLVACIKCHTLEGVGGNVGPDLTRIWETQSVEKILESILEPSKEIKEGYQSYQATTRQGRIYQGLKVAQTADEVILRDAEGKDVHIASQDLEELTASKVSLMPEDTVSQLTQEQLIDLIAFLKDRKAQEALRSLTPLRR
jgi:putative heme-binding domain-containing protein